MAVKKITNAEIQQIEDESVKTLPDNPSAGGLTPYQIKYKMYRHIRKILEKFNVIVDSMNENLGYSYKAIMNEAVSKGEMLQFAGGVSGSNITVKKAVPSEILADPSLLLGFAADDYAQYEVGEYQFWSDLLDVDTSLFSAGDTLYYAIESENSGEVTNVAPGVVIVVGYVITSDTTEGIIKVSIKNKVSKTVNFKGDRTYENLPTENQKIGDQFNITNDFTIGDDHYKAGTNATWNGTGWDFSAPAIPTAAETPTNTDGVSVQDTLDEHEERVENLETFVTNGVKYKGQTTYEDLLLLTGVSVGDYYDITNTFTHEGTPYPIGTNAIAISVDPNEWVFKEDRTIDKSFDTYDEKTTLEDDDLLVINDGDTVKKVKRSAVIGKTILTVGSSGYDYTNLRTAVDYANASATEKNQYFVYIHEGTYNIMSYYTETELLNTALGLQVDKYVHLIGIGNKDTIILHGELDIAFDLTARTRISTIHYISDSGYNELKNLTITSKNIRYAVHDDTYNNFNFMLVEDCKIIRYEGAVYYNGMTQAWGAGVHNGTDRIFNRCVFENWQLDTDNGHGIALSYHNNANTYPSTLIFNECSFNTYVKTDIVVRFSTYLYKDNQQVYMSNCEFNGGGIMLNEEILNSGVGIAYNLHLKGCDVDTPIKIIDSTGLYKNVFNEGFNYKQIDINGGPVFENRFIAFMNDNNVSENRVTENNILGISKRTATGGFIEFITKGTYHKDYLGITDELNNGDKIIFAKNIIDYENATPNQYRHYLSGAIQADANYAWVAIPVIVGETITISSNNTTIPPQFCWFNDETYVSGVLPTVSENTYIVPNGVNILMYNIYLPQLITGKFLVQRHTSREEGLFVGNIGKDKIQVGYVVNNNYIKIAPVNKTDTDWISPTLLNSWVNYGSDIPTVAFKKVGNNFVYIHGGIKDGTYTSGTILFYLPSDFTPQNDYDFVVSNTLSFTFASIVVSHEGYVAIRNATGNDFLSLNGIVFSLE